ncbi:MAG TPA: 3-isopropylmalate dehydrogenase [Gemmatimonadaceae bacterium]|nr:3-isopropylmalate dehydrogenase [Gemmatimonadaceae bacterium]
MSATIAAGHEPRVSERRTARITVLPGDGVGPEVTAEAVKVLGAVAVRFGHEFHFDEGLIGGCAMDATGSSLPEATLELCRYADAVLLGAVGGPKWDSQSSLDRPERGLLALRKGLGVYANLRPVMAREGLAAASPLRAELLRGVDVMVVRELTGGIYFGEKGREAMPGGGERAFDVCSYTTGEVERVARVAGEIARTRSRRVVSVDKANVLETSRLWRSVVARVMAEEFADVQLEHMLVDACAMHLIRRPADFDVIVTENMFGDILTDEASMLAGSMGLLPSASLGGASSEIAEIAEIAEIVEPAPAKWPSRMGLYEPIHGSAPDIAGKGIANPIGAILSASMLLRHSLALEEEARVIESAVDAALRGGVLTAELVPRGERAWRTSEVGDEIARKISEGT